MIQISFTRQEVTEGKRLLDKVLAKILRARYSELDWKLTPHSNDAKAMFDHLRVRNLKSLIIRQNDDGIWTSDLLLKRVPQGVPDVLGIPEQAPDWPYKTRRDALAMMCSIVNSICIREHPSKVGGSKAESGNCATDG